VLPLGARAQSAALGDPNPGNPYSHPSVPVGEIGAYPWGLAFRKTNSPGIFRTLYSLHNSELIAWL